MNIQIFENTIEVNKYVANIIALQIKDKPKSVLGLATGNTPLGVYKELINKFNNKEISFKDVVTFNLDEYYLIEKNNINSYSYYMNDKFFKYIDIDLNNTNIPNGISNNYDLDLKNYDSKIEQTGGIDVQLLGIGVNGHIGFNEPNSSFDSTTRIVKLTDSTINANKKYFANTNCVPQKALSMGIKNIMNSKKIIIIALGDEKKEAVYNAIKGKVTQEVPASILQLHEDVTFVLDKKASALL